MSGIEVALTDQVGWRDRIQARLAGLSRAELSLARPAGRAAYGNADQGRALLNGRMHLGDARADLDAGLPIWAAKSPSMTFEAARQGFGWLDDLAAVGGREALLAARIWTQEWMARFGRGKGPGWTLTLTARRLSQMLDHAPLLCAGEGAIAEARFARFLARHRRFLIQRFDAMPAGLDGFEICGRIIAAGCLLEGSDRLVAAAQGALEQGCRERISASGAIASRNPEELAGILKWLGLAAERLQEVGIPLRPQHRQAMTRIVPAVRALRLGDGTLARFHGGGAGIPAWIDTALGAMARRGGPPTARSMAFVRLARGASVVIADCAAPPVAEQGDGHASTLAFEMSVGQQRLIVNCGPGAGFGAEWHAAARRTPSHATLTLGGQSSSGFAQAPHGIDRLETPPGDVQLDQRTDGLDAQVFAAHNGYAAQFGLIHVRRLNLDLEGTTLHGEDMLSAVTEADKRQFEAARAASVRQRGVPFAIRFHLHPDVRAQADQTRGAATLTLKTGEVWVFSLQSEGIIRLDPSVYLEKTQPDPRGCQQIVVTAVAARPDVKLGWRLARTAPPRPRRDDETADPVAS